MNSAASRQSPNKLGKQEVHHKERREYEEDPERSDGIDDDHDEGEDGESDHNEPEYGRTYAVTMLKMRMYCRVFLVLLSESCTGEWSTSLVY